MRERIGSRRAKIHLYILLNVNRRLLAFALGIAMFVVLLALGAYAVPTFRQYMIEYAPSRYVFQAYVGALITGVTLVVTISLVVLSQEFGPLGEQRERMSGSMSFRADVEDIFDAASPTTSSGRSSRTPARRQKPSRTPLRTTRTTTY